MRKNLTARSIAALKPAPSGRRSDHMDAIVPGFGVRVTDKGRKTFILTARYPGSANPTRRAIAEVGAVDLATAREIARSWLEQIAAGIDPKAEAERRRREARRSPQTFERVGRRFLVQHVHRNELRSAGEIERIFERYLFPEWRDHEFVEIRRGDVARLLDTIEARAPVMADRVLALLSKLCAWYQAREESYISPIARGMRRTSPKDRARRCILDDHEIRLLWQASKGQGAFGALVKLLLLTAQRRAKVSEMRWGDIDDTGLWTIPAEAREKANAEQLQLPGLALDVIRGLPRRDDSEFVCAGRFGRPINGFSKAKRVLDERMAEANDGEPIPHWTLHDLRRTAKSLMGRAGVRPDISERVLGHAIPGVEGTYDHYDYGPEKADALERLAGLIGEIVEHRTVVPIGQAVRA
ncbi:integrase family protein [Parasphingopyxis algicola]|uniref:tyrosine-type recombinase/integrase n=1 Tax=Parasphingopyxis algicola TaxID=2026624 RepID=UPI0015A1A2B2|nr:integrase family protein [Parasphingopyxis algicola]QLC24488.1 integrase family protein [Parasphingopyxis algicola]